MGLSGFQLFKPIFKEGCVMLTITCSLCFFFSLLWSLELLERPQQIQSSAFTDSSADRGGELWYLCSRRPRDHSVVLFRLWYTLKRAASPRAVSLILLEAHWEAVAIPAGAHSGESPFGRGNYDYNLKSRIFNGLVWRILKGPIGVKRNRK